ncbi:MAG TPA: tetratricopeptide repeat protein, partial [Burkholderiaceae bacterium]|nr:tetratricopeptide repeat protein [Burkholderiaceae bacterium]
MIETDTGSTHTNSARARHPPLAGAGALAGAVALVVIALFWRAQGFQFLNFDDDVYITANPFVRGGLDRTNVIAAFTHARGGHYHPLAWLSHMVDVSLFGLRPGPAHMVSVAIHALTTALLFLLVLRCFPGRLGLAAFTALLFGVHPMRLESVVWLAERKDVLALFFTLCTLHAWVSYARRPSLPRYLLAATALVLGLLSKPTVVTLPVLLLLFDRWPLGRTLSIARAIREKIPLALLAGVSVVVTTLTQRAEGAMDAPTYALGDRIATATVAYLVYLGKFFWPAGLGIFYPLTHYPPGVGAGAVVALAAISVICLGRPRERPELAFAWAWFLIAPLPVIGLVQFGGQAFADRWSYLPHLGLAFGLSALAYRHLPPRLRLPLGTVAIVALAIVTSINLPHWATSETIFRHTLAVSPDNFMAHTNLGNALAQLGDVNGAIAEQEKALQFQPDSSDVEV